MITDLERDRAATADSARIWAVSDDRAGNRRQATALADALANAAGEPPRRLTLAPRAPWRWLAPRRWPGSRHAFGEDFDAALRHPPAIALGCGRQDALATRLLREAGARAVQILDPRIDPAHWDLVIAPEHDGLAGGNVLTLLGSLHPVDDDWLQRARVAFPSFADLPAPRTALLVGGPTAHAPFDAGRFDALCAQLAATVARDGGSVLATTSRRTPPAIIDTVRRRFAATPGIVWCGPADGENPYAGLLAWADRIVCTPDSVNMLSEASATRVPVFVFEPQCASGRLRRFLDALAARGRVREADAVLAPFDAEPLRETARIARDVRACLSMSA